MNDDTGGTTGDILALGLPHPAERNLPADDRETRMRRFGRRALFAGITIHVVTILGALTISISTEGPTLTNPVAQMFGTFVIVVLMAAGAVLVALGGAERLQRPQRAMLRHTLTEARRANERLDVFVGTVAALPGRVEALTREVRTMQDALARVPDYGRGVIDGVQVRADALGPDTDRR